MTFTLSIFTDAEKEEVFTGDSVAKLLFCLRQLIVRYKRKQDYDLIAIMIYDEKGVKTEHFVLDATNNFHKL